MSFWRTFGFHTVSAIDTLLDGGEFTLEQLLDEEEILQETKSQNKKLLDFLVDPQTLRKLLHYITVEADEEQDAKRRFKYPFLSCEILASEVWAICDAMYQHEGLLDELYGLFEKDPPLNPLLSTYAARVASVLLQKKVAETITYLKGRKNVIQHFLKHLGNASIMDLLLKVIASEDTTDGSGTLEWLCGTDLIPSLVEKFDPKNSASVHENAAQALGDIIAVSVNSASSPLIAQLESQPVITKLFDYIISGGLSSALENGLAVLIELLRRHMNDGLDDMTKVEDLPDLLKYILTYVGKLHDLLLAEIPQSKVVLLSPNGPIKPLGFQRLKIVEFFSALTHTNFLFLDMELMNSKIFSTCLKLFFSNPWNNFLHSTVEQMIQVILDCDNETLKFGLIKDCGLVDSIAEASKNNDEECAKPKGVRRGYMGHITAISLSLVNAGSNSPQINTYLTDHQGWNQFYSGAFQVSRDKESNNLLYAPSEEFTNEEATVLEDEYENGEDYISGEQDFKIDEDNSDDDDDDEEEGVIVQSRIEEVNDVWEEREIKDTEGEEEYETVQVDQEKTTPEEKTNETSS